ncbi:glycosyltransferase family 2 protein [Cohnella thermotolerans]|uniref:glycosyltransferase family 2 protein n=1 Tax=Cohnella thermotolerans TaxID=329858 RepID=UPI000411C7F8|nr:glycosyltransferase [Cohnella thermotolerans]
MNPDVSVIVPIYNAEDYMPRCLDSLSRQTLRRMEILLVVDGKSSTKSRDIAAEYCRANDRMRLLDEGACGASAVRNVGLRHARGEYVGFVDSDDYVRPEMFADLYAFASGHGLDIAVSGIWRDHAESQPLQSFLMYAEEVTRLPDLSRCEFMYKWVLSTQANPVWNKLYRRELLLRNEIRFDESVRMAEDAVFNARCFSEAASAGSVNRAYYVYFNRPGSQMYSIDTQNTLCDFQQRWDVFRNCAGRIPEGDRLLAVTSLRLIANAVFFFKVRNRPLDEACAFAEQLIDALGMQSYLDIALLPGVLDAFAVASHMDETALANFRKFAEAAAAGRSKLLEWQTYYQYVIEKKG